MKVLGWYITRTLPEPVGVKVPQPTLGEAAISKVWRVTVNLDFPASSYRPRWTYEYFADCKEANEIHPGKIGQQVELLTVDGKHYTCGELAEVVVHKPKVAKG